MSQTGLRDIGPSEQSSNKFVRHTQSTMSMRREKLSTMNTNVRISQVAEVRIVRPPIAIDPASALPRDKWEYLMQERHRFCTQYLPKDCRNLLFFVEDGEANDWIGFPSRELYIREGLGLAPEVVDWAIAGLRHLNTNHVVPLKDALEADKKNSERAKREAEVRQGQRIDLEHHII
jgi:hypothetical protein